MAAAFVVLAACAGTADAASYKPVWLCRPGLAKNPCITNLETGIFSATGPLESTFTPPADPDPPVDCFYVYPTVSAETSVLSDLKIQPAETDVALYQAAYYQGVCRMYAPMYHQVTNAAAAEPLAITRADAAEQYDSVLDAWKYYLKHYNNGRPFVLIGHSQGAFVLRKLIARQIDSNAKLRKRMLSAILFGGGVVVKAGSLVGGDFRNIPGCTSTTQLGCVVSYSSFPGPLPPGALFGASTFSPTNAQEALKPGQAILCTNPAALGGGAGLLDSIFPQSFPDDVGVPIPALEVVGGSGATPWWEYNDAYSAQCVDADGGNFLEVTPVNGASPLLSTGVLAPLWGLHPLDVNLALGDIVSLVASETTAYLAQGG
jgi:pimeloyl-ACP methyl ester carboxylesterase